jgi:hypothetical protein
MESVSVVDFLCPGDRGGGFTTDPFPRVPEDELGGGAVAGPFCLGKSEPFSLDPFCIRELILADPFCLVVPSSADPFGLGKARGNLLADSFRGA